MIFEYVIAEHPSKKDAERGDLEKVVVGPKTIVAKDQKSAETLALLELGKADVVYDAKRIEVLVRPFK